MNACVVCMSLSRQCYKQVKYSIHFAHSWRRCCQQVFVTLFTVLVSKPTSTCFTNPTPVVPLLPPGLPSRTLACTVSSELNWFLLLVFFWSFCQLLSARKYIVSYSIVSYRMYWLLLVLWFLLFLYFRSPVLWTVDLMFCACFFFIFFPTHFFRRLQTDFFETFPHDVALLEKEALLCRFPKSAP